MRKRIISVVVCLLMVLSVLSPLQTNAASSLRKKSMYVGQTYTLKISGASSKAKIRFSSSKPSVATVSKSTGKIKALKAGVATIKATVKTKKGSKTKTKTLKCTVTVRKCTHIWYAETTIKPTCEHMGKKLYTCSTCGMKKQRALPMTEHKYRLKTVIKLATCKEDGKGNYECITCGHVEEGIIPKTTAHTWGTGKITKEPTCSTEGVKTYTCAVCNATRTEQVPINKTAHVWDEGKVTQEANCAQLGITKFTCTECKATKTEYTAAKGHEYTTKVTPASMTAQGYTTYTCSVCKHTHDGDYRWYVPTESYASSATGVKSQNALKPGAPWTSTAVYLWKGGSGTNFASAASGPNAFTYACSDAMFGINPAYYVNGYTGLRAGDIAFTATGSYFVEAVAGNTVYVAHSDGATAIWDATIPANTITHYLSRWYKY